MSYAEPYARPPYDDRMDGWCVLLEEPSPGRVPDLRPVAYCGSREEARAAGDTCLVLFDGMTSRRFVRLHVAENLT